MPFISESANNEIYFPWGLYIGDRKISVDCQEENEPSESSIVLRGERSAANRKLLDIIGFGRYGFILLK